MIHRLLAIIVPMLLLTSSALAGGGKELYFDTLAQSHQFVGLVQSKGEALSGAEVFLYQENTLLMWTEVDAHSTFDLALPTGTHCTIEVQAEGYHPKRISVDTRTDQRTSLTYRFKVEMISTMETFSATTEDLLEIDFPAAMLVFDAGSRRFVELNHYTETSRAYFATLIDGRERQRFRDVRMRKVENLVQR